MAGVRTRWRSRRRGAFGTERAPWIAALILAGTDVLYLVIVLDQGPSGDRGRVLFVAAFIAALAGAFAAAGTRRLRGPLGFATAGSLVLGGLALFSIGVFLVMAGILGILALS